MWIECITLEFIPDISLQLELECRQEILKRILKFSRQQGGKKKKMSDTQYVYVF